MQPSRIIEEPLPTPTWRMLSFGCFARDAGSTKWAKRGAWAIVFPALGFAARLGLDGRVPDRILDFALAASVGAAIGFIHWTTWRYMQDLDELHQRIMLEGFTFSYLGTMTLVAGAGIFGLMNRTPLDILWVYVLAEFLRGIGLVIVAKRYR